MIRTQVYIPDDLHRELKLLVATGNDNFSTLIREGIELVVKKKTKKKRKFNVWRDFIGTMKGGPKDLSKNIDYYLYVKPYEKKQSAK